MQEHPHTVQTVGARRRNRTGLAKIAGSVVAISGAALSIFGVSMFSFAGQQQVAKQTVSATNSTAVVSSLHTGVQASTWPSQRRVLPLIECIKDNWDRQRLFAKFAKSQFPSRPT